MADSIDKLNINTSHTGKKQKIGELKEETKKKLEALGIDPSSVKSETDAKIKIHQAEAAAQANIHIPKGNEANPIQQVFTDAKDLAERVGIKSGTVQKISDLFNAIDQKISNFENGIELNDEEKNTTASLRQEFSDIYATYAKAQRSQARITGDMGVLAEYNRMNASVSSNTVSKKQIQDLENAQAYKGRHTKFNNDIPVDKTMQNQLGENISSQQGFDNKFKNNVQNDEVHHPKQNEDSNNENNHKFGLLKRNQE
jgi:hypothetical protein